MSNNLYLEAISDAKKLREVAELNAKQKLIEVMSPKIKSIIEKKIISENLDNVEDDSDDNDLLISQEASDIEDDISDLSDVSDVIDLNQYSDDENIDDDNEIDLENQEEKKSLSIEIPSDEEMEDLSDFGNEDDIHPDSDIFIRTDDVNISMDESKKYHLNEESAQLFESLIGKKKRSQKVKERIDNLNESVNSLKSSILLSEGRNIGSLRQKKIDILLKNLIQEAKNIGKLTIVKKNNDIKSYLLNVSKELYNMSIRRRRRNNLNESNLFELDLFEQDEGEEEMPEDEAEAEMPAGADVEDEAKGEDLVPGDVDMEEAERLYGELGEVLGLGEDVEEMEEEEPELETEGYHAEMEELDEDEELELGGHQIEIDEGMLRREINRMKRLREGDAVAAASSFGGGTAGKEPLTGMSDSDLNVNDGNLGELKESRRRVRRLANEVKQYRNAVKNLKGQLSEMNLFNAKLLYANKLMQNRDLSLKQQRHIVESLDGAKTLREAKLLFEGLTKSLLKGSSRSRPLSEGVVRSAGASSRSVRSAQPANNRADVDRWAVLAGIGNK